MITKRIHHEHRSKDPIGRDGEGGVEIHSHADPEIAYITGSRDGAPAHYIHRDDVASAIVALIANTGFTTHVSEDADKNELLLVQLADQFVDTYREAMVPTFRQRFREEIEQAESDWDAKCRMARVINEYESLR